MKELGIYFSNGDRWPFLLMIPGMTLLMLRTTFARNRFYEKLGLTKLPVESFEKPVHRPKKALFYLLGLTLTALAAMGPQWGQKLQPMKAQGLDICFAFDLSRSMWSEDVSPNRLTQAKNQLKIFLPRLGGDRAALVGFSSSAFIAAPLSTDHDALAGFLDPLDPSFMSDPSTSLSTGVDACMDALNLKDVVDRNQIMDSAAKLVVLLTDGEETSDDSNDALKKAEKLGVPVYVMAVGTAKGGPIALRDERGNLTGYLRDPRTQQPAVSKLEDKGPKEIAQRTGGKVFYASMGVDAWKLFEEAIANYKRDSRDAGTKLDREERFQIPLLIAFVFLLLDFFLPETRLRAQRKAQPGAASRIASGVMAALLLTLVASSVFRTPAALAATPPGTEPSLADKVLSGKSPEMVYRNNEAVKKFQKQKIGETIDTLSEAINHDSSDPELRFNWSSAKLYSAVGDQGQVNPKIVDESIKELQNIARDPRVGRDPNAQEFRKLIEHQLGQAYEMKKDIPNALKHYYSSLNEGTPNSKIDERTRTNLKRLLVASEGGQGGGGEGDPKDGKEGEGDPKDGKGQTAQPKDGEDHTDAKMKPKFSGTEIDEGQAKQILESVSGEEQEVQRRKATLEAKERRGKGRMGQGKVNSGQSDKPW